MSLFCVFNHGSPHPSNIEFRAFGSISFTIGRMVLHTKIIEGIFGKLFLQIDLNKKVSKELATAFV